MKFQKYSNKYILNNLEEKTQTEFKHFHKRKNNPFDFNVGLLFSGCCRYLNIWEPRRCYIVITDIASILENGRITSWLFYGI